jgi:hypothetical protein
MIQVPKPMGKVEKFQTKKVSITAITVKTHTKKKNSKNKAHPTMSNFTVKAKLLIKSYNL